MPAPTNISDDYTAMDYIRRLKDYRKKHGMSLEQVGQIADCSYATINRYENGRYIPDINTYNALADFFKWPRYSPQHNNAPAHAHLPAFTQTQEDCATLPLGFTGDNDKTTQPDDKKRRAYSIPENLLDDIRDIATIKGCSMSEIITRILEEYTAKHKGSLLAIRELRNS